MAPRVAFISAKGGTLKSSSACNIAGQLAASGADVLLVDMDPQGNCRLDLGVRGTNDDDNGSQLVMSLLTGVAPEPITVRQGLDHIVGGTTLQQLKVDESSRGRLGQVLDQLDGRYDIVIIDSPPGSGDLRKLILDAATALIIPTRTDAASRDGIPQLATSVRDVRRTTNADLQVAGAIVGPVSDAATRVVGNAVQHLQELLGEEIPLLTPTVPAAEALPNFCREHGLLVHEVAEALEANPRALENLGGALSPGSPAVARKHADSWSQLAQQVIDAVAPAGGAV